MPTVQETLQAQINQIKVEANLKVAELEAEIAKQEGWLTLEWEHARNFVENIWAKLKPVQK
jgi:hypothetical protein